GYFDAIERIPFVLGLHSPRGQPRCAEQAPEGVARHRAGSLSGDMAEDCRGCAEMSTVCEFGGGFGVVGRAGGWKGVGRVLDAPNIGYARQCAEARAPRGWPVALAWCACPA